ncbi:MAG: DUF362 domain-containing protein [Lentisphaeria bacterium]|nr:DUF362 domain-containing protein [Lentisphaeria bacterium]
MEKSTVYFTNMRTRANGDSLLKKMRKLLDAAGMGEIDFNGKFTAIKIHFGEPGNLAFLRPNFARVVVDAVKEAGGKPFLTDCNTLYAGRRKNALEHLEAAWENGFTPYSTGCPILIGDGLKGTDDVEVPVPNGEYVKTAKIGRAVMDADVVISLNHFKGHELTGFGGAIKNIGMGCGSRAGKKEQHCDGVTEVKADRCIGCRACGRICAHDAPNFDGGKAWIDPAKCVGCGRCIGVCPTDAIAPVWGQAAGLLDKKMAEYALAVLHGRPHFHISVVMDVSPYCDCHAENDAPIVPDVGIFASFDPVALDQACCDAVNDQPALSGSVLGDSDCRHKDHLNGAAPGTDWKCQLQYAEKIGLGQRAYKIVEL